ncbi:hypothetical protein CEXT_339651 [Caerostris extrusa]|uniref:Uncharacterized protein n=1 Tax=Caerostris extrusa TaxID=172846 RepID=A0AAV4XLV0_CAEEX|nr:hypothetical protein CEXT_339651 [Caerostris extrusa]
MAHYFFQQVGKLMLRNWDLLRNWGSHYMPLNWGAGLCWQRNLLENKCRVGDVLTSPPLQEGSIIEYFFFCPQKYVRTHYGPIRKSILPNTYWSGFVSCPVF